MINFLQKQYISKLQFPSLKRIFLVFPPLLSWFLFKFYNEINYSSVIIFIISAIIFWNFPIIVTISNSKPIYHEDLFLNSGALPKLDIEDSRLNSLKEVYTWIAIITNSILTAVLFEYWVFKTQYTTSVYEVIGVSGGILKIFQLVNQYTGIISLKIIKYKVKIGIINENNGPYQIEDVENINDDNSLCSSDEI